MEGTGWSSTRQGAILPYTSKLLPPNTGISKQSSNFSYIWSETDKIYVQFSLPVFMEDINYKVNFFNLYPWTTLRTLCTCWQKISQATSLVMISYKFSVNFIWHSTSTARAGRKAKPFIMHCCQITASLFGPFPLKLRQILKKLTHPKNMGFLLCKKEKVLNQKFVDYSTEGADRLTLINTTCGP